MSHATAGELHALMDGALRAMEPARASEIERHLETCADCRALLEDERAVRDRAGEILASVGPIPGDRPAFEEIEARAAALPKEAPPPGAAGGRGAGAFGARPQRLAWAASLVVALGAGWIANAVLGGNAFQAPTSREDSAASTAIVEAFGEEADRAEASDEPVPARPGDLGRQTGVGIAESSAREPSAETEALADDRRERRIRSSAAEPPPVPEDTRVPSQANAPEDAVAAESETMRDEALTISPLAARATDAEPAGADAARAGETLPADVGALVRAADGASWAATDATAARQWLGRAPYRLPGVEAQRLEVASVEGRPVLRSTYVLESGAPVVLLEAALPVEVDELQKVEGERVEAPQGNIAMPSSVSRRDGAMRIAWIVRGDVRLVLAGSAAVDSLIEVVSNRD